MGPTEPTEVVVPNVVNQESPEKTNVQKRIDEITAEKYAAQKQVEQLTETVAMMLRNQSVAQAPAPVVQREEIPEGLDPAIAKFLSTKIEKVTNESKAAAQQMFWQMQNQLDATQVGQKYAHLPPEVRADAAARLTGLKQQYGQAASMDDAVALAFFAYSQKQGMNRQAQQFNQMNQPMNVQGLPPQQVQQSQSQVTPASLPNWDSLDVSTQNRLIDEWEKKGGSLLG